MIEMYTDGACKGNPGPGGWAAVLLEGHTKRVISGRTGDTTNNRMELMAAIKGLEIIPEGSEVTVHSDSKYVVNTMSQGWKRNTNLDLWEQLDSLSVGRKVTWQWVQGHAGDPGNEEANDWATAEAGLQEEQSKAEAGPRLNPEQSRRPEVQATKLTHLDRQGRAGMVDVGWKPETEREAVARCFVSMEPQTLQLIQDGQVAKGDVLATARLAGIMGAKQTPHLIPLCHPIPLNYVGVEFEFDSERGGIHITASAKTSFKTGVEMEALTAVSVAALTLYDMCKSADKRMRIQDVRLVSKRGGKSGDLVLE